MASKELLGIFMSRTLKAENLLRTLQKDLEFLGKVLAYKSEREKEAVTQETAALQAQVGCGGLFTKRRLPICTFVLDDDLTSFTTQGHGLVCAFSSSDIPHFS